LAAGSGHTSTSPASDFTQVTTTYDQVSTLGPALNRDLQGYIDVTGVEGGGAFDRRASGRFVERGGLAAHTAFPACLFLVF
jgi:hypothetical protein